MLLPIVLLILLFDLPAYCGKHKKKRVNRDSSFITKDTYPNAALTPGSIFQDVTRKEICRGGYSRKTRDVSQDTKRAVKLSYGLEPDDPNYSIDHFIPLSLGGTNDISNLWPQKISGIAFGANQKSRSDYYLYTEVCAGRMSLYEAQQRVKQDWVKVFREYCGDVIRRHEIDMVEVMRDMVATGLPIRALGIE